MDRAVIYARYSSEHQDYLSITAQLRACTDYCRAQEYIIVRTYTDEARSATTDDRPAFLEMIRDARAGLFDVIVVHKLDRFARNRYDSAIYKRELQRAGVRRESVLERLDDSEPEGNLYEGILDSFNEFYSRNLARESMKGLKEIAYQAKHCGGRPALGYDVDPDGHYQINEREAVAVRLIFEMSAAGDGYSKMIDTMAAGGHVTKTGKPFGKNSIHEILKNEKYIGVYIFNRVQERKTGLPRSSRRKNPDDKIIRIPGAVPAIIDEEVFSAVQDKLVARRHHAERARNVARTVYLLSGLVRCGECGSAYVGTSTLSHGKRHHYYECGRYGRTRDCKARRVNKDKLEEAVLAEIRRTFFSLEGNKEIVSDLVEYARARNDSAGREMNDAVKEVAKVKREMDNLIQAIADGAPSRPLKERIETLDARIGILNAEITRLSRRQVDQVTPARIEKFLGELGKVYAVLVEGGEDRQVKTAIQKLIKGVEVQPDRVILDLHISLGTGGVGEATWSASKSIRLP